MCDYWDMLDDRESTIDRDERWIREDLSDAAKRIGDLLAFLDWIVRDLGTEIEGMGETLDRITARLERMTPCVTTGMTSPDGPEISDTPLAEGDEDERNGLDYADNGLADVGMEGEGDSGGDRGDCGPPRESPGCGAIGDL